MTKSGHERPEWREYGVVALPFVDGNKRIGIHTMLVFLAVNGVELFYTQEDLISLGLSLAEGKLSCDNVLRWITEHQCE